MDWLARLFDSSEFRTRWESKGWSAELAWLHNLADALILAACIAIPATLIHFARRRRDLPFPWIFWLFGGCILACGTIHLMEVIVSFVPMYRLSGVVKMVAALVWLATAFVLVPLTPRALALRGHEELEAEIRQRTLELAAANGALIQELDVRRQVEEDLRRARDELEARVHERTADLEAVNEALRLSNRELEEFAYVASHDLQEPLRKIQAFGDRLLLKCREQVGEQGREYIERMHASSVRMQRLIIDLLSFSRVTTQARPFQRVDLGTLAQEALSDLEERIQKTEGRVDIGAMPVIDADPTQMRQLLQNLIANGLKFHKPGQPPVVQVESEVLPTAEGETEPTWCELRVRDNGIGFEEQYLDRIFQVFRRLHGRNEYEGTGVGLAICRKIAERHGGSVTAHSAPGEGATFLVRLPLRHDRKD